MHLLDSQVNVLIAFALADHFRFLSHKIATSNKLSGCQLCARYTCLFQGISILLVHISHNRRHLTFEPQLVAEIQPRRINYRKQQAVVLGLAYFNTSRFNAGGALSGPREEPLDSGALFGGGSGRDLGRFKEQAQQGSLARALPANDLLFFVTILPFEFACL
jgi:hypothetical protein